MSFCSEERLRGSAYFNMISTCCRSVREGIQGRSQILKHEAFVCQNGSSRRATSVQRDEMFGKERGSLFAAPIVLHGTRYKTHTMQIKTHVNERQS